MVAKMPLVIISFNNQLTIFNRVVAMPWVARVGASSATKLIRNDLLEPDAGVEWPNQRLILVKRALPMRRASRCSQPASSSLHAYYGCLPVNAVSMTFDSDLYSSHYPQT